MVVLEYFSYRPNFPALNNALYLAFNGNWSAFDYNGLAQAFTTQALHPIPTICSDARESLGTPVEEASF